MFLQEGWGGGIVLKSSCSGEECRRWRNTERRYCLTTQGPCVAVSTPRNSWLRAWYACVEHLVVQDTHLEKSEAVGEELVTAR